MKSMTIIGIVLLLLGAGGLAYGHINYTTRDKVLDVGPIHATADRAHTIAIPDVVSIAALIAGLAMVVASLKRV